MKTISQKNSYPKDGLVARRLTEALDQDTVETLARQTRFQRRKAKKLTPLLFLQSCFAIILPEKISYRTWAILIGLIANLTYSKQALFKRMNAAALRFVQAVLQVFLIRSSLGFCRVLPPALERFPRVILQDSVILTLPPQLARFFPGTRNQCGQSAQVRVQTLVDIKHEEYLHFDHSAYTCNDLAVAADVLKYLRAGDLFIRDLGYFALGVLRQLMERGVNCLSRLKTDVCLFDSPEHRLDLVKLLHGQQSWDQALLLGAREKLPMRLVALKVSEAEANRRRREARKNRRCHPSKKHLFLLGWDLFVTTVKASVWSPKVVGQIYGLRWRIETTFKAWKQHFHMEDVPAGSPTQAEVLLYARLLFISLFEIHYLAWWDFRVQRQGRCPISLLKLAGAMQLCLFIDLLLSFQERLPAALRKQIAYHCTYEKRNRKNFIDKLNLS